MTTDHQRQPLTASEVLRRYGAGDHDFCNANLSGCNLRGADLSGADFSRADIRGAQFVNGTLRGANFSGVQAGPQTTWQVGQLFLIAVIASIAGLLQGYGGGLVGYTFVAVTDFKDPSVGIVAIASLIFICTAIVLVRQGFTLRALGSLVVFYSVVVAISIPVMGWLVGAIVPAVAVAIVAVAISLFLGLFSGLPTIAMAIVGNIFGAYLGFYLGLFTGPFTNDFAFIFAVIVAGVATVVIALAGLLLALYAYRTGQGDRRFESLRTLGLAVVTLGGTRFCGADLTEASFAQARLKGADFADSGQQQTRLEGVNWQGAKGRRWSKTGSKGPSRAF